LQRVPGVIVQVELTHDDRVLVIDDSPVYRHLISGHLREWGFEVMTATSGVEGWEILRQPGCPTLVISDWVMPGMDGIELCQKVRQSRASESYVYFLLLTSKDARTDLLKAMEAGADDYLVKPFDEQELKARLLVGTRILRLQKALVEAREAMRFAATYDALTGLLNRREIVEAVRRELARARREKKTVAVIMADIDHFKKVNDQLGHLAGDEVLAEVGRRLRAELRTYDAVGRYGGEEFLLVMPGCDLTSALIRADQIRLAVSKTPVATAAKPQKVTVSMGVAVAKGGAEVELQSLLHLADLGLYKAKEEGRNRVGHIDEEEAGDR